MSNSVIKDPLNIIICGVGGQGNILASELLASVFVEKNYFTTVGETYGASQRGGPVMSHVRISKVMQYGPLVPRNEADIIIGFEAIETLRVVREYGNKETLVLFDSRLNYPISVLIGEEIYPSFESIENEIKILSSRVHCIEATRLATELGNSQAANILLMGSVTALQQIPINAEEFNSFLEQRFKGNVLELNQNVFKLGYSLMAE